MVKRILVKKRKKILDELTQEIPASGIITVGSDSSATIDLKDEKIAPEQFVIVCENDSMTLLCRVDGTKINGRALPQGALHQLRVGDEIRVNGFTLVAAADGGEPLAGDAGPEIVAPEIVATESVAPESVAPEPFAEKTEKSLSDVLENLRAEERFYFQVRENGAESRRAEVAAEEMWLGWAETGECAIAADPARVAVARAQIRKDWSGVVLYPLKPGSVWLNEETLTEPRRLKNDDKLFLVGRETNRLDLETEIKFHEPTALLILDSLLPKELPPPISLDEDAAAPPEAAALAAAAPLAGSFATVQKIAPRRNIFGFFTITEIIVMAIGTLITAAIIHLILVLF